MRRRLRHLALFLVLGAVINYALAMGIIWIGPLTEERRTYFLFDSASVVRLESVGMTRIVWFPMEARSDRLEPGEPPAWSRIHRHPRPFMHYDEWRAMPDRRVHDDVAAGWPLRSVRYHSDTLMNPAAGDPFIIQSGIGLPPRQMAAPGGASLYSRAIPLRILPLGFAINTVLFASLAAIVWLGPPAIRCFRRTRGNRCLKCGYPREGLADEAACPECGTSSAAATEAV